MRVYHAMTVSPTMEEQYARPDFRRDALEWQCLNGEWDFRFDDNDIGLSQRWHKRGIHSDCEDESTKRTIQVLFVFQSKAPGVDDQTAHEVLWYEWDFCDIRTETHKRNGYGLMVRFGAVDYIAKVFIDGTFVGEHCGGHVPFELDITDTLGLETCPERIYRLTVRVFDSAYGLKQPRGKQYWGPKPKTIYYTPSSGIWQSVWLESVPSLRIADSSHGTILRSNDIEGGELMLGPVSLDVELENSVVSSWKPVSAALWSILLRGSNGRTIMTSYNSTTACVFRKRESHSYRPSS